MTRSSRDYARALLVLGRVSNLPTVWSNGLAGWLLGGGQSLASLLLVWLGTTCLYVGGMFLNDAFDADFDRRHRAERPIPRGQISEGEVWQWGFGWLAAGLVPLAFVSGGTFLLGGLLCANILLYDWLHKRVAWGPGLMASCRGVLYVVAASAGAEGVTGAALWAGLGLTSYTLGLSAVARIESTGGVVRYWPCAALAAPFALAWIGNTGEYRAWAALAVGVGVVWALRSLTFALRARPPQIGRCVSGLLAGIVWVDMAMVIPEAPWTGMVFVALFCSCLIFQRWVPAT